MSIVDEVLQRIEDIVQDYNGWSVVTTPDWQVYHKTLGAPPNWHFWDVETPKVAAAIESYLVARGMKADADRGEDPGRFICIFRRGGTS